MDYRLEEKEFVACGGSTQFAKEMANNSLSFANLQQVIQAAREIWFNKVDVNGWLEAFSAHPQIGQTSLSSTTANHTSAQWSKGEQSTALATSTESTLQELYEWNARYRQKFGFVFLICASGRTTPEILSELKRRYSNRPIVEFEIAAQEQMKITEIRLTKLFASKTSIPTITKDNTSNLATKAGEERVSVIGAHLTAAPESRTRPPITTHVLDVSRGSPAAGIDIRLERWNGSKTRLDFEDADSKSWILEGSLVTNSDGRSGHLMDIVESVDPGVYRISFNTGKYVPDGFFPYVSIVFEIRESQRFQHFHVPLLLSPFSFTTYRGS